MTPIKDFFDASLKYAEASGGKQFMAINPYDDPQLWADWAAYLLGKYNRLPVTWKLVEAGQLDSFTVPAERPELFDISYNPIGNAPRRRMKREHEPSPEERARVMAGFDKLSAELHVAKDGLSMKNPHPLPKERISDG